MPWVRSAPQGRVDPLHVVSSVLFLWEELIYLVVIIDGKPHLRHCRRSASLNVLASERSSSSFSSYVGAVCCVRSPWGTQMKLISMRDDERWWKKDRWEPNSMFDNTPVCTWATSSNTLKPGMRPYYQYETYNLLNFIPAFNDFNELLPAADFYLTMRYSYDDSEIRVQ